MDVFTYQLRVNLRDRSALHSVQKLFQFTEGQLAEFEFIQSHVLSVKEPPPEVIPAAVAHGLLHAALNLPARRQHLRAEQGEERTQVEEPLGVVCVCVCVQEALYGVRLRAGCRGDGDSGVLPQVQFRFPPLRRDGAAEVTGVTVDLRKLLKAPHVCSQTREQLPLTGHDHVETQPETSTNVTVSLVRGLNLHGFK